MRVQAASTQSLLCTCAFFWSPTSSIVNGFSAPTKVSVKRLPVGRISTLDRSKLNPGKDADFYDNPNMVTHADDQFISKVTDIYSDLLPRNGVILDIMSSHVSHLPELLPLQRVDLHGMNGKELEANPSRDQTRGSFMVRDLNEIPSLLGFGETAMYDAVLCCCSVQYLENPEEVFAEVARTLKPGGKVIVTFTNRFFPQKAVNGWIERGMKERGRLVKDYLRAAGGFEEDIQVLGEGTSAFKQLLSVGGMGGDPFVAVVGTRDDSP